VLRLACIRMEMSSGLSTMANHESGYAPARILLPMMTMMILQFHTFVSQFVLYSYQKCTHKISNTLVHCSTSTIGVYCLTVVIKVTHSRSSMSYVCMYVCMRKFITCEFLQPKQSRVCARKKMCLTKKIVIVIVNSHLYCASYNTCKDRWRITSNVEDKMTIRIVIMIIIKTLIK